MDLRDECDYGRHSAGAYLASMLPAVLFAPVMMVFVGVTDEFAARHFHATLLSALRYGTSVSVEPLIAALAR